MVATWSALASPCACFPFTAGTSESVVRATVSRRRDAKHTFSHPTTGTSVYIRVANMPHTNTQTSLTNEFFTFSYNVNFETARKPYD